MRLALASVNAFLLLLVTWSLSEAKQQLVLRKIARAKSSSQHQYILADGSAHTASSAAVQAAHELHMSQIPNSHALGHTKVHQMPPSPAAHNEKKSKMPHAPPTRSAAQRAAVSCIKTTEDACGDPDYTPPTPNPSTPLDQLPDARPPAKQRRFVSALVEAEIKRLDALITDPALNRIWKNAYPNTLDTTVGWTDLQLDITDHTKAFPRSYIITGDIEASWFRDSTNQLVTYLPLLQNPPQGYKAGDKEWTKLYRLALGLVYQQSQFVITDPYANAFGPPANANIAHQKNSAVSDPNSNGGADWFYPSAPDNAGYYTPKPTASQRNVTGNDGVYLWESKWEVDSLVNFLHLPIALYNATGRRDFVNNPTWQRAVRLAVDTLRSQQRSSLEDHEANRAAPNVAHPPGLVTRADGKQGEWQKRYGALGGGAYRFQRDTRSSTETKQDAGFGEPASRVGLVKSAFRPSDDSTTLPFLIPANAYLAVSLQGIAHVLRGVDSMQDVACNVAAFATEIRDAISAHAVVPKKAIAGVHDAGDVYAYEVDGYGSTYLMDDANVPSLLSLPLLGYVAADDATYQRTRRMVFSSKTNKWFFDGPVGSGIGSPHVGFYYAWPMSRAVQILTTADKTEQKDALQFLRSTTAGTGLIHESQNIHDPADFTRPWFSWVNGLTGQALQHVGQTNPDLLAQMY
ncbi:glycoside hydrolase family 125 protein [Tilletiaria anomala UBC 951]|uniref:Glycoside hydrolase family 125 protein n=1 Tax=Tilletiaria anomala (strain ATCC 24038 / CBS 436.72 / UBC 951) TaxID=1037660 RepID=A0A066VGD7_TILAU|nr:glycoside hydrolase family 125 protein [Tilletiaria anomala UBC 951]KDN40797.1 glycoside hydrolase family 125 protein [Tilletiaria anomala UBC 951]